jgi:hypothetical protein
MARKAAPRPAAGDRVASLPLLVLRAGCPTPTDRLSSTLKQLDSSDTVIFWLPSGRWSNLPVKIYLESPPALLEDTHEELDRGKFANSANSQETPIH